MKRKKYSKKSKSSSIFIIMGVIILIGISVGLFLFKKESSPNYTPKPDKKEDKVIEEKKLKIVDENSNSRNIAVMVNNLKTVWGYQSGLQDAYILYEIIVEGGITRLMGIYKDASTSRIGTVRSSRIYYLDYALENDALYVHIGGSKEALADIKSLNIADFNSEVTYRDRSIGLSFEHTAFTSIESINEQAKKRKIRTTTEQPLLLNYSIDEVDLSKMEGSFEATKIKINYSGYKNTSFEYDEKSKNYKRFQNDIAHTDYVTKEQYTAKNIITYQVPNSSYDTYGRQKLDNTGNGKGYFITNGYAIPITWEKKTRSSQTIYRYLNGEKIKVSDGNTHIEIQPQNKKLIINELNY